MVYEIERVHNLLRCGWSVYRRFLDLIAPPRCVMCKKVGTWLCDVCATLLLPLYAPICPRCGRLEPNGRLCPVCQATPLDVAPIRATFLFQGAVRDVIHALKYRGARHILTPLTPQMAEMWKYYHLESDLLVPVPLYAGREAQRGYNQSTLVAQALARQIGVPVAEGILRRVRNTRSQTKLNRQERQRNVKDAFAYNLYTKLDGRRVTLIDDVATTGATLQACAMVLLSNGAHSVNAFTLARAS